MLNKDTNSEKASSRLQGITLTRKLALGVFSVPVLIAFGAYFTEIVSAYKKYILPLDPWNNDQTFWRQLLTIILLIYTGMMFLKQWGYYFVRRQGKSGFFVETCGVFNDRECSLDLALSFWGGVLVLTAWGMPSYWLPGASVYFFLVFLRCRVSLHRKKYAAYWRAHGEGAGPNYLTLWSTFPHEQIVAAAKVGGFINERVEDSWKTRLRVMQKSLDWLHPTAIFVDAKGERRELKAKEILAGWDWVDRMYALIALIFSVLSWLIIIFVGTGAVSFFSISILGGLIFVFFLYLGNVSKDYGINNCVLTPNLWTVPGLT